METNLFVLSGVTNKTQNVQAYIEYMYITW